MKGMMRRHDGILVLDKPRGLTSRDALNKAWKWLPRGTRIGHAGTLDPMATGVLLACVGRGTRLVEFLHHLPKTYRADILFGARSTTDDADGDITPVPLPPDPGAEAFTCLLASFTGDIMQAPSAVSAVKVAGQRAYHLARKGREIDLPPRPVRIDGIQLLRFSWPEATIRVHCGKGTYIRSIGRDLGAALGTAAYLTDLCRERVGDFTQADAIPLDTPAPQALQRMQPLARAIQAMPRFEIAGETLDRLLQGQKPTRDQLLALGADLPELPTDQLLALLHQGELKLLAHWRDGQLRPRKVFLGPEDWTTPTT
jgi:tRNA pseudouridine55 synthase